MKNLIEFIKKHFDLNRHEALSVITGVSLILFFASLVWLFDSLTTKHESELILREYANLDAPLEKLNREKTRNFYQKSKGFQTLHFSLFNPNKADLQTLTTNGIPRYAAQNLINFRNKGKVYRTKEELLKVYGMTEEIYQKIERYIDLPSKEEDIQYSPVERIYEEGKDFKQVNRKFTPKTIQSFDINLASQEELKQIRGIGEVFAKRIISYRNGLGGFSNLEQVKGTYGLADSTYKELVKVAYYQEPPKKIKINLIEENEWKTPLLKAFQKKAILAYRRQHGFFDSSDDLAKIKILNQELIESLKPYLDFSIPN